MKNRVKNLLLAALLIPGMVVILLPASGRAQRAGRPAFDAYYQALNLIEAGDLRGALAYVDTAISIKPSYSQFYVLKGQIYELLHQPDSMLAAYEKALELKSYYPELWPKVARVYLQTQQYSKAVQYLEKALKVYPDSTQFLLLLGQGYYRLQRCRLAENYLRKYARRVNALPAQYWKWRGMVALCVKKYDVAISALQQAKTALADDWEVWYYLGVALFENGQLDQGLSHLNKALQLNPKLVDVFLYRARYFRHYNKPREALEQLYVALNMDSNAIPILLELGKMELARGEIDSAAKHLGRVIHLNPRVWEAYRYLGKIAEAQNNVAMALQYYTLYMKNVLYADPEIEERIRILKQKQ